MNIDKNACYVLRTDVAVEDLDDGTFVFQAADAALLNINSATQTILKSLDGKRTLKEIAQDIAALHNESQESVLSDVLDIIKDLKNKRIVKQRLILPLKKGMQNMNKNAKYLCNPDVSCRIEDDDGAILYCTDTSATQIINPMGLEIWETLSTPHTKEELVTHLQAVCEDVPEKDVLKDVEDFVMRLLRGGFVGEVEEETKTTNLH